MFIIEDFKDKDFYGEVLLVDLKEFMRAEALFSNFDALILAIQCDIESSI